MTDINIIFSREILQMVQQDVRAFAPGVKVRKDAWVWCAGQDHWEFHGPDDFYWHGSAGNAYEARANGWRAWLSEKYPQYAEELEEV